MNNEQQQRNEGYNYFFSNTPLTVAELKEKSPFFRLGYRAAQADSAKKTGDQSFPTTLYEVPRRPERFVPDWNDILAATRKERMRKLHTDQLRPVLNALILHVEHQKNDIYRYSDVVRLVEEGFDRILQLGYDEGILNSTDLKQYNYVPK